ncbi:MAG: ABC transporter permease [Dehalococcoidia bacterium]|nr:ABC transporter permease [Dehalococcoidia bacterium]
MQAYILNRLVLAVATVFFVATAIFFMVRIIPGDAVFTQLQDAGHITPEQILEIKKRLGLDDNALVQLFNWYKGILLHGDFGISFVTRAPVVTGLIDSIPVTVELVIFAWTISLFLGITVGTISALKPNTPVDYFARLISIFGLSVPEFVLATVIILVLSKYIGWLPPIGYHALLDDPWANIRQYFIPAILMGFSSSSTNMRITRSALLEVIRQDYIRTARAKGLAESSIIIRHALKNALAPVFTLAGTQLARLLGGTVIVETIFTMPGVGTWILQGINARDYPVVQTAAIFLATVMTIMNLIVDVSLKWLDPRVKY